MPHRDNNGEQIVIACTAVRNEHGQYLLQRRIDPHIPEADGRWELPGGKIRFHEGPADAAVRECREETGCEAEVVGLIPYVHTNQWARDDSTTFQVFVLAYLARYVSGEPVPSDVKVAEVRWCTVDEVRAFSCLPGIQEVIALAETMLLE